MFYCRANRDVQSQAKKVISTGARSGSSLRDDSSGIPLEYRLKMKDLEVLKEAFDVSDLFV